MYYIIYKTTNKINDMYYIGMHKTRNLDDGYLGSGKHFKRALEKYGEENFEREILEYCDSDEEMHRAEARYVTEDVVNDKNSYNLKLGGEGGWDYVNKIVTNDDKKRFSEMGMEKKKELMNNPEWYERWYQNVVKQTLSQDRNNKLRESLKKYYKTHHNSWLGRHHTESAKRKMGEKNSIRQKGEGNSNFGKCWISNTLIRKCMMIRKEYLYDYIAEGWIKKRVMEW